MKARNASILAALVSLSFAAFLYVVMAERWGAQEGFDPYYANSGYHAFAGTAAVGLMLMAVAVALTFRPGVVAIWSGIATAWIVGGALALLAIGSCFPTRDGVPRFMVLLVYASPLLIVGLVVLLLQVRIARQLRSAARVTAATPTAKGVGIAIPVVLAAIIASAVLPVDRRFLAYRTVDAMRAVWRVHACAHRYAARNPARGFPSAKVLFSEERACLGPVATGRASRFSVDYTARDKDSDGRISNFLTRTRQKHLPGQRYESLAADATGIVHIAYRRDATLDDHVAPVAVMSPRYYTGCIDHYKYEHESKGYPIDWSVLHTEKRCEVEPRVAPNVFERSGYRVTYQPLEPDSAVGYARGYAVKIRPTVFGETGVRSFHADHTKKAAHATGEDRDATTSDPLMKDCEMESGRSPWEPCPQDPLKGQP